MKKILISLLLVYALVLATACPIKESDIARAKRASNALAGLTADAITATRTAFENKLISLEQKNSIADALIMISRGGTRFTLAVKAAESSKLLVERREVLNQVFSRDIVEPFLSLLQQIGLLKNAAALAHAIDLLRVQILVISKVFSRNTLGKGEQKADG